MVDQALSIQGADERSGAASTPRYIRSDADRQRFGLDRNVPRITIHAASEIVEMDTLLDDSSHEVITQSHDFVANHGDQVVGFEGAEPWFECTQTLIEGAKKLILTDCRDSSATISNRAVSFR